MRATSLFLWCAALLLAGCAGINTPVVKLEQYFGEPQTFDYQGLKINYYEAGQGPPVMLLHGFGACAYTWRHLAPPLAQAHRVYVIDLKGFGYSDKPADGKYAVADQAEMVAAFIQARDLKDLAVVGHSMGGAVALITYFKLRESDPARINKLVLIDSAGYRQKMPWFIRFARMPLVGRVGGRLLSPRLISYLVLRRCYHNDDKITDAQIDTYAYFSSLPGAREAVMATARQLVPDDIDALTAQYKTIRVPVLVIWGAEDKVVPLEVGKKFERDIPGAKLVILPQCGHIPPEEEEQATTRLVVDFLQ